ncbi:head GIN domain-containing protein [Sphingomonas sp.]|uniref:head GIN domain-containing protein n=1 Tax=Sphingomonas sp. TaxID=28214 RepID=UPI0035A86B1B
MRAAPGRCDKRAMRSLILLALAFGAIGAAPGPERRYSVTSFDRIRVDGPIDVEVRTGTAPMAMATGDAAALDGLLLKVDGQTLTVRRRIALSGARDAGPRRPVIVTLGTPVLRGVAVNAGGRVTADRMVAQRIDLAVNGSGTLSVAGVAADNLVATITGAGTMTLAGKAGRARYLITGPGSYAASALIANDLFVSTDGPGEVAVAARYTADIVANGLGSVTVAGSPACRVKATGGGAVVCTPKR